VVAQAMGIETAAGASKGNVPATRNIGGIIGPY